MPGDLPRARIPMRASPPATPRRRILALVPAALTALALATALPSPPASAAETPAQAAATELGRMRAASRCDGVPTEDTAQPLEHRGRPASGITGRERGGSERGPIRDFSVFDAGAGRVVSYVCFANASARRAGEAIVSLAEISTAADARVQAMLPGSPLALESIQRYRTSGEHSVYYEARYASTRDEVPFLEPPVRLLLNASTGELFRLDVDPDWLEPGPAPRLLISRKSAERIAAVVLGETVPAGAYGAGALLGKVGPAEMFMVRANAAPGAGAPALDERARPAWVVPFTLEGAGDAAHALFVDAATGRVLGGSTGLEPVVPAAAPALPRETR